MQKPREYQLTLPDGSKRYEFVDPEGGTPVLLQIEMFKRCTERSQPAPSNTKARRKRAFFQLDRLTHHVHILEMNGDSYRLKQSKRRARDAAAETQQRDSPKARSPEAARSLQRGLLPAPPEASLLRPADAFLLRR